MWQMSSKRSCPTAIHFVGYVSQPQDTAPFIGRHQWSDILMPVSWISILAIVGALTLGAALGLAN